MRSPRNPARGVGFDERCPQPGHRALRARAVAGSRILRSPRNPARGVGFDERCPQSDHRALRARAVAGSRILRSPRNPARGFLPRAFGAARDAIHGIA
ncbi:MAG: hypothetical protein KGJ50_00175 [Xanthomonadaceae bacterium]|nr:hypothetical protein [Xanthomonadaceae bacterium]MDE2245415.1 hypothetical protein [Xanthomonadaceae bacterium]